MDQLRAAITGALTDFIREHIRRIAMALGFLTVAFILVLVALGFAIGGVYAAIAAPLGPIAASFIMAGIALLPAIALVAMAGRGSKEDKKSRRPTTTEPETGGLGSVVAAFAYGFARGIRRRPKR